MAVFAQKTRRSGFGSPGGTKIHSTSGWRPEPCFARRSRRLDMRTASAFAAVLLLVGTTLAAQTQTATTQTTDTSATATSATDTTATTATVAKTTTRVHKKRAERAVTTTVGSTATTATYTAPPPTLDTAAT